MAVINDYVDSSLAAGLKSSSKGALAPGCVRVITFEVAAADSDGSVYRLCTVGSNEVPVFIPFANDAITAGTDYDLGLYEPGAGATVLAKDCFVNGADMSSAHTIITGNGLAALDIAYIGKSFEEILTALSVTSGFKYYDLAWTANTVGSAAGTLTTVVFTK